MSVTAWDGVIKRSDDQTIKQAQRIAAEIRENAQGQCCGDCMFGITDAAGGVCSLWKDVMSGEQLVILTPMAPACKSIVRRSING